VDRDAERLVHEYMGLAASLAQQVWRTAPHALELDELRAVAYLGLVGAADRWKPYCQERGFSPDRLEYFKPFVVRRVRGSLIDAIRAADWATRSLRTRARALQEAKDANHRQALSHDELAQRTGMSVADVRNTMRGMAARPTSLEAEDLDPGGTRDNVESSIFTRAVLAELVTTVRQLPADQQTIIALHYHRGLQLQEVARVMGITESLASALHARAVLAIHHAMAQIAGTGDRS
jgi:RNA polymerase sigma factor FliA